ncbi:MAG: UTP--glucose-1-phosphate uridylyltransferase, partial [Candidatus Omnitrophica bacterium]|nr:UTP--glucose-1-phosphate uridylyltransferase [Candidatus Omnitrophota bacterium]
MLEEKIYELLKEHRQDHIIRHIELLDKNDKEIFIKNLANMNLELTFQLYEDFLKPEKIKTHKEITPPHIVDIEQYKKEKKMLSIGEDSIKAGETAVMIVAGGQGSRLGYPYPKGMYPISPVKGKSLFQIAAEKVLTVSLKYKIKIPLLIMTNPETKEIIENFFHQNNYFGLKKEDIFFFNQDILPSITPDGKLIIKEKTSIFANPDGHGGSLKAIWQSGLLDRMEKQGVKRIFYCHIDNPLVNINDPVFLGWHIKEGAEFSLKVVKKRHPEERVGHFVISDGKPTIIEYIEFPEELKYRKDENENLVFWAGSIGIHFIEASFIRKLNKDGFALPYHRQVKKARQNGEEIDIWKFETFVFDAIPLADKVCCVETIREDEFAPLKNKDGEDSPEEVKKAMVNFYRRKLEELGIYVSSDVKVEVSPLCNIDTIAKGLKDKKITRDT